MRSVHLTTAPNRTLANEEKLGDQPMAATAAAAATMPPPPSDSVRSAGVTVGVPVGRGVTVEVVLGVAESVGVGEQLRVG